MLRSELVRKLNRLSDVDVVIMGDYVQEIFDMTEANNTIVIKMLVPKTLEELNSRECCGTQMGARPIDININEPN